MRVLHVLCALDQAGGGPLRAVLELSHLGQESGLESEIVGVGPIRIADNPLSIGVIHSLPLDWPQGFRYSRNMKGWLLAALPRFDAVVLHGMWMYPGIAVMRACMETSTPYAYFPHGMLEPWSIQKRGFWKKIKKLLYWHLAEKRIARNAICHLFTTERELTESQKVFHVAGPKKIVAPYGVRVERSTGVQRMEEGRSDERFKYVLFLGRLHPGKNVPLLLDAWARAARLAAWRLIVAGPGSAAYRAFLRRRAAELGISSSVEFLDFVSGEAKEDLFLKARWFVLPSEHENFGLAALEAICHRVPIVVSDQVYLADDFEMPCETLPLDVKAWTTFFSERMSDEQWRLRVLRANKDSVAKHLAADAVGVAWASAMTEMLGCRPRGRGIRVKSG